MKNHTITIRGGTYPVGSVRMYRNGEYKVSDLILEKEDVYEEAFELEKEEVRKVDEKVKTLRQLIVKNLEQSRMNNVLAEKVVSLESDEQESKIDEEKMLKGIRGELDATLSMQKETHTILQKLLYQLSRDVEGAKSEL